MEHISQYTIEDSWFLATVMVHMRDGESLNYSIETGEKEIGWGVFRAYYLQDW